MPRLLPSVPRFVAEALLPAALPGCLLLISAQSVAKVESHSRWVCLAAGAYGQCAIIAVAQAGPPGVAPLPCVQDGRAAPVGREARLDEIVVRAFSAPS